jgi:two-component system alkaline phosphatase synthesis response regulator PhoP
LLLGAAAERGTVSATVCPLPIWGFSMPPPTALLSRKTILVVEDDRAISDLLRDALETEGYRCIPASEGHFALEMARDEQPSLITLDLDLPDTDGHAVLHSLKRDELTQHIPVVVVSAFANKLPRDDHPAVVALLSKPFDVNTLADLIRETLTAPVR